MKPKYIIILSLLGIIVVLIAILAFKWEIDITPNDDPIIDNPIPTARTDIPDIPDTNDEMTRPSIYGENINGKQLYQLFGVTLETAEKYSLQIAFEDNSLVHKVEAGNSFVSIVIDRVSIVDRSQVTIFSKQYDASAMRMNALAVGDGEFYFKITISEELDLSFGYSYYMNVKCRDYYGNLKEEGLFEFVIKTIPTMEYIDTVRIDDTTIQVDYAIVDEIIVEQVLVSFADQNGKFVNSEDGKLVYDVTTNQSFIWSLVGFPVGSYHLVFEISYLESTSIDAVSKTVVYEDDNSFSVLYQNTDPYNTTSYYVGFEWLLGVMGIISVFVGLFIMRKAYQKEQNQQEIPYQKDYK